MFVRMTTFPVLAFGVFLFGSACVTVTETPPPGSALLGSSVTTEVALAPARPFLGLELEERLGGSLDDLAFLGGLYVADVAAGSPAERSGLRGGDLVVEAAGVELDALDAWEAVLDASTPGETLRLTVERDRGLVEIDVDVERRGGAVELPARTRFVDRVKARVVVSTVVVEDVAAARIERLLEGSPLADSGIETGDLVLSIDGRPVGGGRGFVETVATHEHGAELDLEVSSEGDRRLVELELWGPPRRLTGLSLPILFSFSRDLAEDETEFALIDLWLLALYDYRRDVRSVRHRLLHFFVFETGVGELVEESS